MKCLLLSLILPLFWIPSTWSDTPSFRKAVLDAGKEIPQTLIGLGYSSFGTLDLKQFLTGMPGIEVTKSSELGIANANGRISGRWQFSPAGIVTIKIDPNMWDRFPAHRSLLSLHEYLAPFFVGEDDYWLSIPLWVLTHPVVRAGRKFQNSCVPPGKHIRHQSITPRSH